MQEMQFECKDGATIGFSPFSDQTESLSIGFGIMGTGKTYLKQRLSLHLMKNGVKYYCFGDHPDDELRAENLPDEIKKQGSRSYKYCDIDELHRFKACAAVKALVNDAVRSWRTHNAGLGLWVQHPHVFEQMDLQIVYDHYTTLWFMSFQTDDLFKYYEKFIQLSEGEIDAIKQLAFGEAYLIQRATGISKAVKTTIMDK